MVQTTAMARLALFLLALLAAAVHAVEAQAPRCKPWCKENFVGGGSCKPDSCTSLAKLGTGPCYDCGPRKTVASMELCGGACTDTATDNANCGSCGNSCSDGTACSVGVCESTTPPPPPAPEFTPCDSPFTCGSFPSSCGAGTGDSDCMCFTRVGGSSGSACLDSRSLGACSSAPCSSDADCSADRICISTCCGNTCGLRSAGTICPAETTGTKLFRRRSIEELMATTPELNATLARQFINL